MKSVSKFLFNFFDMLESEVFTEGILGIILSLHNSENTWNRQKTLYFHNFGGD